MKIIGNKEIDAIKWALANIGNSDDNMIDVLNNIVERPDYESSNHDEFMMYLGRESVNPNFDYCILSESLMDTLYLTDDYETALRKAKSLSIINKDHVFSVFSIKETEDGYKTFYEMQYDGGEAVSPSHYMFLHYDYLSRAVKNIVKL